MSQTGRRAEISKGSNLMTVGQISEKCLNTNLDNSLLIELKF